METQGTRRGGRTLRLAGWLAVLGLGLTASAPAQARNEFENGFEDPMGRIFAVETFRLGSFILGGILHGGHVVHAVPRHYTAARHRYEPPRRHWRDHRWKPRRHHRRHRHHDDCDQDRRGDRHRW